MKQTMQFIDIDDLDYVDDSDAPEVLKLRTGNIPTAKAGEVLIKVVAAGVNRPDVMQRKGLYPAPVGASPILGLEVSGKVAAVGEGVTDWQVGDQLCALTNGGGYAEYVAAPAAQCLAVPVGLTMIEAAALPETCFTVWSNLFDRAQLSAGESLLIHGGSSGIGTTAIQMAAAMGARVFTTTGSDEKCQSCLNLGAEIAINYHKSDFVEILQEATNKTGVNVILDMVGGDYIAKNLKLAALDGRVVNIAYMQGSVAKVNFLPIMLKRLTITGSTLRPQTADVKATIAENLKKHIWPLIEKGKLKPVIARSYSLKQAADAHILMESNQHIGKIVLTVGQE